MKRTSRIHQLDPAVAARAAAERTHAQKVDDALHALDAQFTLNEERIIDPTPPPWVYVR